MSRPGRLIYRHGYEPGLFLFTAGLLSAVALVAAVMGALEPSPWGLPIVAVNLALAAAMWRMSRMGARLDHDGVVLFHAFRTIRIPWSDFRRFTVLPRWDIPKTGYVELLDGSLIWIKGLGPWGPLIQKREDWAIEGIVSEMNHRAEHLTRAAQMSATLLERPDQAGTRQ